MASHYLFFESKDTVSLIDVMRPRPRPGETKIKPFSLDAQHKVQYGDLAFIVMNDGQLQRITGEARDATKADKPGESRPPIYTVGNMVTAELVDFTSQNLPSGTRTYRADFFRPTTGEQFAYATTYGTGKFAERMLKDRGLKLEMLTFVDYLPGEPISKAIIGTFKTFDFANGRNPEFIRNGNAGLALVVPGKLIER